MNLNLDGDSLFVTQLTKGGPPLWMRILGRLGIGEVMLQCETCGALIDPSNMERHEEWHGKADSR